ncbi:MAG: DUF1080 domain-containing protein [Pirellulaceae bacterium]
MKRIVLSLILVASFTPLAAWGDYELYFEWRFKRTSGLYSMPTILPDGSYKTDENGAVIKVPTPNADSGLLFRPGHQANLWCWSCGSGELWMLRNNKSATPEQRATAVPKVNADKPVGQWNTYRVTCRGPHIAVEVNGQKVNELDLDQWTEPHKNPDGSKNKFPRAIKDFARRGYIGLQDHGRPVWYRNIRIKPLEERPS